MAHNEKLLYKLRKFLKIYRFVNFQKPDLNDSVNVATHISATAILMCLIERL